MNRVVLFEARSYKNISLVLFTHTKWMSSGGGIRSGQIKQLYLSNKSAVSGRYLQKCYSTGKKVIPKKFRKPLLPFEIQTNATTDILLYIYHGKERLFTMIPIAGIFLFCVLMNSAELIYTYPAAKQVQKTEDTQPWYYWWKHINISANTVKIGVCGLVVVCGVLALCFGVVYPTFMIREITLLRGGEKILLQTYRPFGFTKTRELSLKQISAQWGPKETKNYLPLKMKGKRFHYLVNQDGEYCNKRLFDQTVALHRF